jgi:DNA-dependent RNA polymerase
LTKDLDRSAERAARESQRAAKHLDVAASPQYRALVETHLKPLIDFIAQARAAGRPTRKTYAQQSLTLEVWDAIGPPQQEADDPGLRNDDVALAALVGVILSTAKPPKKDDDEAWWDDDDDDDDGGDDRHRDDSGRRALEVIGAELERLALGENLRVHHKSLEARISRAVDFQSTPKDRRAATNRLLREHAFKPRTHKVEWTPWGKKLRIKVGAWGFDSCLQALRGVIGEDEQRAPMLMAGAWSDAVDLATKRVLNHPVYAPDLKPPAPWTWFYNQDHEPFLRHCRDVQAAKDAILNEDMRRHLDGVNYLKSIAWRINEPVADFVLELGRRHHPLLGIKGRRDRGDWRVFDYDMKQVERLRGKTFWTDINCDWRGRLTPLPHFNYGRGDHIRGLFRFAQEYPIGERGIWWLKVATANCYDEDKLIRRQPFEERVAWTERNLDNIREIAAKPQSGLVWRMDGKHPWLSKAADPIRFVAHAIELAAALALERPEDFKTSLPIALDASNSGAQHYSMLARDRKGAELTNLLANDAPKDLYGEVLDINTRRLTVLTDEGADHARFWLTSGILDREVFKKLTMTFLYGQGGAGHEKLLLEKLPLRNAQFDSEKLGFDPIEKEWDMFGQQDAADRGVDKEEWVRQRSRDLGYKPDREEPPPNDDTLVTVVRYKRLKREDLRKGSLEFMVGIAREAIATLLPGADKIQKFVRGIAAALATARKPLRWPSPAGVPACNEYLMPDDWQPQLGIGGRPFRPKVVDGKPGTIDAGKCARAAAPNLIHSLDASHLALVALACERENIPLTTVHDSFAVPACYVDKLQEIWARELRAMYDGNSTVLNKIYDYARRELGPDFQLPEIPQSGDLELSEVQPKYGIS